MTKLAKHKIRIEEGWSTNELTHKYLFKSIRSKVLQRLVLLAYNATHSRELTLCRDIQKRLTEKGYVWNYSNVASELTPEDVMTVIPCKERTAKEYIDALRQLWL